MQRVFASTVVFAVLACSSEEPANSVDKSSGVAVHLDGALHALAEYEFTRSSERLDRALEFARLAVEEERRARTDRVDLSPHAVLGRALILLDDFDAAREATEPELVAATGGGTPLDVTLLEDRGAVHALAVLGEACLALGALDEARAAFARAVELGLQDPAVHHMHGQCLEQLGDDRGAHDAYAAALALDSTRASTYLRLAAVLERSGDAVSSDAAMEEFFRWSAYEAEQERALGAAFGAPDDAAALVAVAHAELDLGHFDEARAWAKRALDLEAAHFGAEYVAGLAASAAGDDIAAGQHFARAVRLGPGHVGVRLELAFLSARRGNDGTARASLAAARERGVAAFDRGLVLLELGDDLAALSRFEEHLSAEPDHIEARLAAAQVLVAHERLAEAADRYEEVLALDPEHEGARGSLRFVQRALAAGDAR